MKKILKSCLLILVAVCVSFSFVGCKKKVSPVSINTDNVKSSGGVTTNGGITVVNGDYLYFINGTKDNDGTSIKNNKRAAICRVKYDQSTGKTSGDMEVIIDELAGFANASLNIFGDYLYYTTPCADENYKGEVLYYKTTFHRYDLVNKKSYELFTTELNNKDESIKFAHYIVGEDLNLVVYEKTNQTVTSLKLGKKVTTNYVISEVQDCLLSENYGKVVTTGVKADANSYVFYSKSPKTGDYPNSGKVIYKTSPIEDNSVIISKGKEISFVAIRSGKMLFNYSSAIYMQTITDGNDTISTDNKNCISREVLDKAIYIENYKIVGNGSTAKLVKQEGSVIILYFDSDNANSDNANLSIFQWQENGSNIEINYTDIATISSTKDFEFIGITRIEEITKEDDEKTTEVNEEEKKTFLSVLYKNSSKVYKIRIGEVLEDNTIKIYQPSDVGSSPVKLSDSTLSATNGIFIPEVIDNNLYILAQVDDKNDYLIKVDLTPTKTVSEESELFGITE